MKKECENCGRTNKPDASYCEVCGPKLFVGWKNQVRPEFKGDKHENLVDVGREALEKSRKDQEAISTVYKPISRSFDKGEMPTIKNMSILGIVCLVFIAIGIVVILQWRYSAPSLYEEVMSIRELVHMGDIERAQQDSIEVINSNKVAPLDIVVNKVDISFANSHAPIDEGIYYGSSIFCNLWRRPGSECGDWCGDRLLRAGNIYQQNGKSQKAIELYNQAIQAWENYLRDDMPGPHGQEVDLKISRIKDMHVELR